MHRKKCYLAPFVIYTRFSSHFSPTPVFYASIFCFVLLDTVRILNWLRLLWCALRCSCAHKIFSTVTHIQHIWSTVVRVFSVFVLIVMFTVRFDVSANANEWSVASAVTSSISILVLRRNKTHRVLAFVFIIYFHSNLVQ